jgi:hypothetical protein
MKTNRRGAIAALALVGATVLPACAPFQNLLQPPTFDVAADRASEIRLLGPAAGRPLGGAQLRLWTHVHNPNTFGMTLTRLTGHLVLEGDHAAEIDLPLGLPLRAAADTIVPLDLSISFADLPGLANHIAGALTGQQIGYEVRGIIGVNAGPFGEPSFGPATWMAGEVQVVR